MVAVVSGRVSLVLVAIAGVTLAAVSPQLTRLMAQKTMPKPGPVHVQSGPGPQVLPHGVSETASIDAGIRDVEALPAQTLPSRDLPPEVLLPEAPPPQTHIAQDSSAQSPTQPEVPLRDLPAQTLSAQASHAGPAAAKPESEADRLTRLARADDPNCDAPWTYSRGLHHCICVAAGYSVQWGRCLPMRPVGKQAALPKAKALAPADNAARMEAVARAQDCLSSLGLYGGLVDGMAGAATQSALSTFLRRQKLPPNAGLFSPATQKALQAACSGDTASLPERPPRAPH